MSCLACRLRPHHPRVCQPNRFSTNPIQGGAFQLVAPSIANWPALLPPHQIYRASSNNNSRMAAARGPASLKLWHSGASVACVRVPVAGVRCRLSGRGGRILTLDTDDTTESNQIERKQRCWPRAWRAPRGRTNTALVRSYMSHYTPLSACFWPPVLHHVYMRVTPFNTACMHRLHKIRRRHAPVALLLAACLPHLPALPMGASHVSHIMRTFMHTDCRRLSQLISQTSHI